VRVFVPTKLATPASLVVMLHGCTQTGEQFADATQMDALAETEGFVVAYPEQSAQTISTKCFQWYEPAHQARDAGEPKDLADGTSAIVAAHGVDAERVYVAGISAGAAMAVILGATYPDRFTAIGVVAGIEYKGATSPGEGFSVTMSGGPSPDAQGALAFAAMGARARAVPTFVVHGTSDGIVAKVNGDQVAAQWLKTNTLVLGDGKIDPVAALTGNAGYPFTRFVYRATGNGASVIEHYVVDGLGHAWPGGKDGGSYSDKLGPNASALAWGFFKGRTRTAPLDVPPIDVPDGGTSLPDGGTTGPTPPGSDPANPSGDAPVAGDAGSSGGCAVASTNSARDVSVALLASLAAIASLRRRRR
jgi:poly(hydroxyalkanoate) depolymerase family esterase